MSTNAQYISIRKVKEGDAKQVVEFLNYALKKGHMIYTGTNYLRTKKDIKKFNETYCKNKKNEIAFVAVDNKDGRILGISSFDARERGRTSHRGELGWTTHPDYGRKGIGTKLLGAVLKEAKKRGFRRAEAEIAIKNIASIRLAKKFGFKIEGRRKSVLLINNKNYLDTYIFGKILK